MIEAGAFDVFAIEGMNLREIVITHGIPGPAFSAINDRRVLGAAGVIPVWRGVGNAWLLASDELRRHPMVLHRYVRRGLVMVERGLGLHRTQIAVHQKFTAACQWAERLGFAFEGEMKGYGPNGDTYLRYARVKDVSN